MFTQMGTSGNLPFSLFLTLDLILYALLPMLMKARIAQSVEHGANNARVAGSRPAVSILFTSSTVSFCSFQILSFMLLSFLILRGPSFLSRFYHLSLSQCLSFYKKDELGRDRTCNPQIRSLMRFHCATSPHLFYSLFFVTLFCLPLYSSCFLLFIIAPFAFSFLCSFLFLVSSHFLPPTLSILLYLFYR